MAYLIRSNPIPSPLPRRLRTIGNTTNVVNKYPYCAELFNPNNVPYGFKAIKLAGLDDGYPIWFDINLSEDQAQRWFTYLKEGLLIDRNTRQVQA